MKIFLFLITCVFCSVQFYGNTKNMHDDMPIKTDQDTIREGYRYDALFGFYRLDKKSEMFYYPIMPVLLTLH